MDEEHKQQIALFRFRVIADLVGRRKLEPGTREAIIRELADQQWNIPFSTKTSISRSTIREWLRRYRLSGERLESLFPKEREDAGVARSIDPEIDPETELALVELKRQLPLRKPLSVLLRVARQRKILPPDFRASAQSIYRLFRRHGLHRQGAAATQDRRRFEAELPNDLWQADCMHVPLSVPLPATRPLPVRSSAFSGSSCLSGTPSGLSRYGPSGCQCMKPLRRLTT